MNIKTLSIYSIFLFSLLSCTENTNNSNKESMRVLPNFPAKIQAEIDGFKNKKLVKTVTIDGDAEVKNIEKPDWTMELALFLEADINKPAWQDKYALNQTGNTQTITATDDKLIIKKIEQTGEKITIEKEKKNLLYQSKETLTWQPQQNSYNIISDRKVVFGDWQHIEINGKIK